MSGISGPIRRGQPVRLADLHPGDAIIVTSADWECISIGMRRRVKGHPGALYVSCRDGRHLLDGQEDEPDQPLVGIEVVR
jgi:hypothetical protein